MNISDTADKTTNKEKSGTTDEMTSEKDKLLGIRSPEGEVALYPASASTESTEPDFKFVLPVKGFDLGSFCGELDQDMLIEGRLQLEKEINTVKGQLTQPIYDLLHSDALTKENLLGASDKVTNSTVENKFVLLKRRYYVQENLLHDVKRKDLVVYEPNELFDLIMSVHVLNSHVSSKGIYNELSTFYANVTQSFCKLVTSFCSKCNESGNKISYKKFKHENIHANLIPLGRCHVEIFAPFDSAYQGNDNTDELKIEGKYPFVLYCRDYYSRYVWLEPLKSVTLSDLLPVMTRLLFSMIRMPIFIDTCTLDRQDMFDVCENIARIYKIKIGLGMNSSTSFQKTGIKRMKSLFLQHKEECLHDWNMCLKLVVSRLNQNYSDRVRGVPSDLLCSTQQDLHKKFRTLQRNVISRLLGHHVVQFEEAGGMIYLEDENSPNLLLSGDDNSEESEHDSEIFDELASSRDGTPISEQPSPHRTNMNYDGINQESEKHRITKKRSKKVRSPLDQDKHATRASLYNPYNIADVSMEL